MGVNSEHGYHHERVEGPYDGIMAALKDLSDRHGPEWVDEEFPFLSAGELDGTIAWFSDDLGYSITDSEVE